MKYIHINMWLSFFLPGGVPYPTLTNTELYRLLGAGYRMERPDMCSDDVYVSLLRSFYNNYLLTDLIFFSCLCFVANYIERHSRLAKDQIIWLYFLFLSSWTAM